ncbi:MAG: DUF1553 domain-containing protein [Planctomycetaceae bacterium]
MIRILTLGILAVPLLHADMMQADDAQSAKPVLWTFDESTLPQDVHGDAQIVDSQLQQPAYPDFPADNKVLQLKAPAWISLKDGADETKFDFDNGDAVTFEAWVRIDSMTENVYLVSKGRTGTSGNDAINQNWAFRLRNNRGQACVNFLFRSRPNDAHPGDWHRWTSKTGFSSGSRWHHVAVSYRFGEPDTICGFIDGKEVNGDWDMGGATTQPPVVDNAPVWIGSSMGGAKGNSLHGAIDNLTIHRSLIPAEELLSRFRWNPPPVKPPTIPSGKVVVQLFGPVDSIKDFPLETGEPLTQWEQDEMAFVRLPHKYDSWGVREDWGKTLLVRAWTTVHLPAGDYRLLARSRGMAVLKIDDETLLTTPPQPNRGGAHHVVDELPEVPVAGMRPHSMSASEKLVTWTSDGKPHRMLYQMIVGGPSYRTEFGEACVAVAPPEGMFHLLSQVSEYPLTDDGWLTFATDQSLKLKQLDQNTRHARNAELADYWDRRHAYARRNLLQNPDSVDVDQLIAQRIASVNARAAASDSGDAGPTANQASFFQEHVQPILDAHCTRCHSQKQQGGLLVTDRQRLLIGGESGQAAIVPGKPEESYLFELVSASADDYRMPPKGDGLSAEQIQTMRKWIADGAEMPAAVTPVIDQPSIVDDHTFLRRVYIDTIGVPPTLAEATEFLSDRSDDRRSRLVDRLLQAEGWADNWVGYWQDVLAENPNLLKPTLNNTGPFRYWIHEALTDNKPVDRFATELILMRGSTWGGGAAGFAEASQNDVPMAAKAHVIGSAFLGVNMKCARCHDAPYHQWKQADLFQMAAMLDRRQLKLPTTSTVPAAFFEKQARKSLIEVSLKAGSDIPAHFPFQDLAQPLDAELLTNPDDTREQLAAQVTASRRFAEVLANRMWKRLMGSGIVEPVDDWEGAVPSDPELLAALADTLIRENYDLKRLARAIFNSEVYQRAASDLPPPAQRHFAGPYRRRMTAEQIVDSALHAVGQSMKTEQLTMDVEGTLPADRFLNFGYPSRSWEFTTLANERDRPSLALPKVQAIADVLKVFGWRNSRPEPETEREEAPNLLQPGVLANGTLGIWLTRLTDDGGLTQTMLRQQSVDQLIDAMFLEILTREPTDTERQAFSELLTPGFETRIVPEADLGTPPEPQRFRYVSWSNHLNTEANVIKVQMQELVRKGPEPTRYLQADWRTRAEDAVWSLLNSPEMILVP